LLFLFSAVCFVVQCVAGCAPRFCHFPCIFPQFTSLAPPSPHYTLRLSLTRPRLHSLPPCRSVCFCSLLCQQLFQSSSSPLSSSSLKVVGWFARWCVSANVSLLSCPLLHSLALSCIAPRSVVTAGVSLVVGLLCSTTFSALVAQVCACVHLSSFAVLCVQAVSINAPSSAPPSLPPSLSFRLASSFS
jgi:hypothetical protein